MTKTKAATEAKNTAVGQVFDYGVEAGQGFEDVTSDDLAIPFINVLQPLSPQIEEVDGAKSGMIFNTVTNEMVSGDEGIVFLPCHQDICYMEWIPRSEGGGLAGRHERDSLVVKEAIKNNGGKRFGSLMNGSNELQETHYVYGLLLDSVGKETQGFGVISFTSTKLTPKKNWFTAMYSIKGKPPLFANRAVIKTKKQKNDHGTFYNFKIEPLKGNWKDGLINPQEEAELLEEAISFREMVLSGKAKADHNQEKTGDSKPIDVQHDENGEEIPF